MTGYVYRISLSDRFGANRNRCYASETYPDIDTARARFLQLAGAVVDSEIVLSRLSDGWSLTLATAAIGYPHDNEGEV